MKMPSFRALGYGVPLLAVLVLALPSGFGCGGGERAPRRLTIGYSNDLWGEIRSCGCASKDLGGLGRRATFLKALRDTTGDFLLVESGDFFGSGINYGVEKADLTMKSMAVMGYHGVVIGEDELGFGLDFLRRRARETGLPVVVANLYDAAADTLIFPASRVVTLASGRRVGIVGALSPTIGLPPQVADAGLDVRDPLDPAQRAVDALRPGVDVVVVLAHMPRSEAQNFARSLKGVDAVFHGHDGRPMRQLRRFGEAYLLELSSRGLYMGVAYATLDREGRIAGMQDVLVPMDNSYEDDEAIAKLFRAYDLEIAAKERATLPTGITDARTLSKDRYRGAEACRECHGAIYEAWSSTRHAHAWSTLTELSREYDRDCIPCHTAGFYKTGGFENIVETPNLVNVQCESCHGNGAAHAANPSVPTGLDARSECRGCHNADQSPEFDLDTYWARIDHGTDAGPARSSKGR